MPSKYRRRCKCEWEKDERTPEDLFLSVLKPHLSTNSLVLCRSWTGYKDEQVGLLPEAFGEKNVYLKIIPLKTTKYAQPLDVYFFRQYKIYAKKITDVIKLRTSNMQPKLHGKFFMMKLHSVIYNKLSVDNFTGVIDMTFSTDIKECAVTTCDHLAFLQCVFRS